MVLVRYLVVGHLMVVQVGTGRKPLPADSTLMGLLAAVYPAVGV